MKAEKNFYYIIFIVIWALLSNQSVSQESDSTETRQLTLLDKLYFNGRVTLDVSFQNGSATLQPESQKFVEELVQVMNVDPALNLIIESYAGVGEQSESLASERAKALKDAIVAKGIDSNRLRAKPVRLEKLTNSSNAQSGINLVVVSALDSSGVSLANVSKPFGIDIFPEAALYEELTRFSRNILGIDGYCFVSSAELNKVKSFFDEITAKLTGFMPLYADETTVSYMKNEEDVILLITISSPWLDSYTGKTRNDTQIMITKSN